MPPCLREPPPATIDLSSMAEITPPLTPPLTELTPQGKDDRENCTDHRHYGTRRRVPGRIAPVEGLRRARHQATLLVLQYGSCRSPLPRSPRERGQLRDALRRY